MSDVIRLLIADDHLIVRQGLRLILETEDGFELVGEASDVNTMRPEAVSPQNDLFCAPITGPRSVPSSDPTCRSSSTVARRSARVAAR